MTPQAKVKRVAAYGLVVVASTGAALWSGDRASDQTRAQVKGLATRLADAQRAAAVAGCYRSRDDRMDAVRGWSTARHARLATAHNAKVTETERLSAAAAAAVYAEVIRGYKSRLVDCQSAFPAAPR